MENNISHNEEKKQIQEETDLKDISFVDISEKPCDEQIEYIASVIIKADDLNVSQKVKNRK